MSVCVFPSTSIQHMQVHEQDPTIYVLFGYFNSMWIEVYWVGLICILTYYEFKTIQSHSIHIV
jgi:hypothetical protein